MMVNFTIPGKPGAKGRPRFTKGGHPYTPKETVAYENLVKMAYMEQVGSKRFPDDASLMIEVYAFYPIPKSASKKKQQLMESLEIRPAKKPDVDNVLKIIADSLNDIAYKDDSQIVSARVEKYYSEAPRVSVGIWQE